MKRIVTFGLLLVILLTACKNEQAEVFSISEIPLCMDEEALTLQRKLAQWYNLNLLSSKPDAGFEAAYESILCFENGIMGYVEIPKLDLRLPIYHGSGEVGFRHDPNSSFPIGGDGNHTVLYVHHSLNLDEGDIIVLRVLENTLNYQIGGQGEDLCTIICGKVQFTGARVVED